MISRVSLLFGSVVLFFTRTLARAAKPNVLFLLADDLGWADVGFHGGNAPTPNLDRLGAESVELTQRYVYPVVQSDARGAVGRRYATLRRGHSAEPARLSVENRRVN